MSLRLSRSSTSVPYKKTKCSSFLTSNDAAVAAAVAEEPPFSVDVGAINVLLVLEAEEEFILYLWNLYSS